MSKPKGAPPPGWRPTVKGKSGFSGTDVLTNAAQGGDVVLPDAGAPVLGSRFGKTGGAQNAEKSESDLKELFAGDLPNYGQYRAVPTATADRAPARRPSETGKKTHDRFFDDDDDAKPRPAAPASRQGNKGGFDDLFEGLDDGDGKSTGKPAAKADVPNAYPGGRNDPDYRGLFERLQNPGRAQQEEAPLFKQTAPVEEPQANPQQPALPRATMGGGKPMRRGQKLILDLDSFLVDCAVDWGRERLLKGFNLCGKADEGVTKWSETMQSRGVLTVSDFRSHGVELDLSDSAVISTSYQQLEKFNGALKMDQAITTLRLSRAQLGDTGCSWLAGGMMKNRTLKELILSENEISDTGVEGLAAVLDTNTTLTSLDLSSNSISSTGASLLADGLKRNRKLRELNLSFNGVEDVGAQNLADAVHPGSASNSVLRTLNLTANPVGKVGCTKLLEAFQTKGTFMETLFLPDEHHTTKEPDARRKEPEKFVVECSETGVDIRAAGRRTEQVTWMQEAEDIELTFKETWIQKMDIKATNVEFGEDTLRIEVKGITLMDAKLGGRIKPKDSSWTIGNGILQVVLAKADKAKWSALTTAG